MAPFSEITWSVLPKFIFPLVSLLTFDFSWLQLYIFFWSAHFAALLLTTVLLLYLLEGCGWLEGHACEGWSRVKEVVAGQLYLALAITRFNSHTVEQVVVIAMQLVSLQ